MAKLKLQLVVDDKGTIVIKQFGKKTEDTFKGTTNYAKQFTASLKGMMTSWIGVTAVLTTATLIMKKTITAASDLEEVTSKFDTVFRDQIAQAEIWAQVLVDSYAMSTREAKEYLSSIQDLLVPMGMMSDKAGAMSIEIVKLSADLASFNNLPTSDVMRDIQSALTGQYVTMKKYGVVLNATIVQEKALAMGLADTKKELTAGDKAQASYALMMQMSQAAVGDMARTSGSYANQVKALKAGVEDLSAAFGQLLLPSATRIVTVLTNMTNTMEKLIGTFDKIPKIPNWMKKLLLGGMIGPIIQPGTVKKLAEALGLLEKEWEVTVGRRKRPKEALPPYEAPPELPKIDQGMAAIMAKFHADEMSRYADLTAANEKYMEDQKKKAIEHAEFMKDLNDQIAQEDAANYEELMVANEKYMEDVQRREEARVTMAKYAAATMMGNWAYFFQYLATQNDAWFKVFKAFAIAEATINTYIAATKALAQLGPIMGPIAAAAMIAKGLAMVAQISAMSPGGGGGGGGAAMGTYPASETTGLPLIGGERERGTLTIHIAGDFYGDEAFVDMLADKINAAVEERDVRLVSNESR